MAVEPFLFIAPARLPDARDFTKPVTDGDTLWLQLDRHDRSKQDVSLRLEDVHAPDREDGVTRDLARVWVERWLAQHSRGRWPWLVHTLRVVDESHELMSFARYIARVWCRECGEVLNVAAEEHFRAMGWPTGR